MPKSEPNKISPQDVKQNVRFHVIVSLRVRTLISTSIISIQLILESLQQYSGIDGDIILIGIQNNTYQASIKKTCIYFRKPLKSLKDWICGIKVIHAPWLSVEWISCSKSMVSFPILRLMQIPGMIFQGNELFLRERITMHYKMSNIMLV